MATPFEYSRIHPTVLCISRSSDNTNHPKYSLSLFPPIFSHLRSRGRCLPEPHAPRSGIKTFEDETPTRSSLSLSFFFLSLSLLNPARISSPSMSGLTRVFSSSLCLFAPKHPWNSLMETRKNITLLPSRSFPWIIQIRINTMDELLFFSFFF